MFHKEKPSYLPMRVAYDIETTNYRDGSEKKAIVYAHTFCVDGTVHRFRKWDEALAFFDKLSDLGNGKTVVIYVHNLPYEYGFIAKYFEWEEVFAIGDRHRVVRATTNTNLEFRCSLILTAKSLEGVGKEVGVDKMVGDLDYDLMRHHDTSLTPEEWGYIDNDVLIIDALIEQRLANGDTLSTIPMTKTGYVRRLMAREVDRDADAKNDIHSMTLSTEDYLMARQCFSGGYTHANAHFAGQVVEGVTPFDLASAYPAAIVREHFPVSSFTQLNPADLKKYWGRLAMMIDVTLEGIDCNYAFGAISVSKCVEQDGIIADNGRVHSADRVRVVVTDVELNTIRRNYSIEGIVVNEVRGAVYGRLPKPVVKSVLDLYVKKTTLKGVAGMEIEYGAAKADINSIYGNMATDPVKTQFEHVGGGELVEVSVDIDEAVKKHNRSRSRALFYPWGAWVTAHTRATLLGAIMDLADAGVDVLYCDTDSTYSIANEAVPAVIEAINERALAKNAAAAEALDLDPEMFAPKDPSGEAHPIGLFEHDNNGVDVEQFKTLGAKRYATVKGGKFAITVAGLSKKLGAKYVEEHGGMDFFKDGMEIPAESSGRLVHSYFDHEVTNMLLDYQGGYATVRQNGFVHLEAAPYSLTIGDEYRSFMDLISAKV